ILGVALAAARPGIGFIEALSPANRHTRLSPTRHNHRELRRLTESGPFQHNHAILLTNLAIFLATRCRDQDSLHRRSCVSVCHEPASLPGLLGNPSPSLPSPVCGGG